MKESIYKYIFKRKDMPEPLCSVGHMLNVYGYEKYVNSACSRIADADLLDGEHVQINFFEFPDILLDYRGVYECEDILLGYIDIKDLEIMEEIILSKHQLIRIQNITLEFLRNMPLFKILKMIKDSINSDSKEVKEKRNDVIKLSVSEILARSLINRISQKVLDLFWNIVCKIKYRNILSILQKIGKEKGELYEN